MPRSWMLTIPALAAALALTGCSDLCYHDGGPKAAPPPPPAPAQQPAPAPAPPPPAPTPPPPPPPPQESATEKALVEKGRVILTNVYFDTNKATLRPESEPALHEAGEALEKYPDLKIRVEGHTDKRGSAALNKRLSLARAKTVRDWLVSHYRLNAANYTAVGYGSTRPVNDGNSPADLQANRRVELTVLNPEALPHNVEVEKK